METKKKGNYNFKGENNNHSKLSWEAVRYIRENYKKGETTHSQLAALFRVSRKNVGEILAGKTWKEEHTNEV